MRFSTLLFTLFFATPFLTWLPAQVTADFTANVVTGCGSLQVSFTDLSASSAGVITAWSWNLGGVASVNQNPGRIFGSPGNYTICLTATDNNGNSDTECKQNFITVYNLPSPAFSADNQFGCVPTEITFTDESTSVDGNIVQWIWGLGGTTGVVVDNGSNPVISSTYENPDSYTISLTVTDDNGCVNSITAMDYLTIFDFPVIDISLSDTYNCTTPFIVTATNNNPEPDVDYFWDFGNGFPIYEGPNPPSTFYLNEGSYTITVIAVNSFTNCTDTLILEDIINIGNAVQFSHTTNQGCEDLSVSFTNTSFPWLTDIQWDFGDGNFSTAYSPTHIYSDPGCYIVTLSALAGDCVESFALTECIEVFPLPDVSFSNDNPIGCAVPHPVNFDALSNTATNYSWNFGDGSTSTLQNPSHSFANFGTYLVTLEVTDDNGCVNSYTDVIEILALEALIDFNNLSGCSPVNFTLSENSVTISPITSWYWEIDTAFSAPNSPLYSSTDPMPSFSIADTGWYDITLVVTNSLGCIDTVVNGGAIGVGIPPIVNFEATPLIACVDEVIQFTDLSSEYGDEWFWDFGDGNFSFDQNPTHVYNNAPDTFDVTLNVSHNGCANSIVFEDYIIVQVPLASFMLDRDCNTPYEVAFVNNSTGADSVFWDFGYADDTDTSSMLNPVVVYPDVGCYTATLIAFNFTTGCIDSMELYFCITDPAADFSLSPLSGCSPLTVNITNNSVFDATWNWSGPGAVFSNSTARNPTITYQNPGIYTDIQLIVTDINNCQDTAVFTDDILVDGVDVDFVSLPSGGCQPLSVAFFDNSSSFISPLQSWSWNIGNGLATSNDPNTQYFFNNTGTYPVSLTVTNAWGCVSTLNLPNAINVTTVSAGFEADPVSCPADTVLFTNLSTGTNLTYNWNFGDGSFSNETNPAHQFSNPGTYNVCLNIYDFAGCVQNYCQSIDIIVPVAAFTIDTAYANCPPLIVTFDNQSQNSFIYQWDFGDNAGISSLENPLHVYTIPGVYDVQLVASINEYCTDTLIVEDLIQLDGPVGNFSFNPDSACVGNQITFVGESDDVFTYIWDFGDGVLDTTLNVSNDTIFHVYQEVGAFVPKLTLLDSANCFRTLESPDTIYIGLLEIDFIASDSTLCEGLDEVNFINLINSSAALTDLLWVFENGSPQSSTAFEPTVTFPMTGNFDVSLIVANSYCRDTLTKIDYIGAGANPIAAFSASATTGCIPFAIQYFDQSTLSNGNITNWEWSFGGLGTSDEQNPSFTYGSPGLFDVNYIVTTEYGCSDTTSNEVELFEAITPILQLSVPEICIGDQTQLGVEFETDTTGLAYFWQDDPTLSCLDCLDPFVNPIVTTSYFFITSTPQGCMDTSEIIVNVLPFTIPDISITSDTTLCIDESIQLSVSSDGMSDLYEWDQNADSLSCYDNCSDPIANPILSTLYTVTVTNSFGCDAVDSVFVAVVDQNQAFAGEDRTICEGDSVQLSLLVDGNPIWLNSNGLSCNDCNDPIAFPTQTTTFLVQTLTADFGCEILDTVVVNVLNNEDVNAGDDTKICLGESILLNASTNSPGTILWMPPTGLDDVGILNPVSTPTDTITYLLSIEEDLCTLVDSVEIVVQYSTAVESFDYEICAGDTVQISFEGEADNIIWTPGYTLSDIFAKRPLAFPTATTEYILTASLSTCEEDTAVATVLVNQGPELSMPSSYDKFPGVDLQITLEVLSGSGDYSYYWPLSDGLSCNNCPDPVFSIDTSGFYTVIVTDEATGCETRQRLFINKLRRCDPDLIYVPNIFTPNEDGYNDKTEIFSATITEIYIFRVYSRWGALLFETNNINEGWDGRYKNKLMPSGVYVYYLEAPCIIDGSRFLKKGSITLVR